MELQKIKILYLYAEIMGYNEALFKEYVHHYKSEVHVVHWDRKKHTPYVPSNIEGVLYYKKSQFNRDALFEFVVELQPTILFTSGWMDKDYRQVCKQLRKQSFPIVALSDTPYYGTLKQKVGCLYFKYYFKKNFDYLWVAGAYQYEYGKRLGFGNNEIIFNALSADLTLFNTFYKSTIAQKQKQYPHQFVFVGRLSTEKGLDILQQAWHSLEDKKDWKLLLVGQGPLKEELSKDNSIELRDFVSPESFENLIAQSGCLVLPSRHEPWALVLHEFAAAGLPLVCSDACGAATMFVINDYNGWIFPSEKVEELRAKMQRIIESSNENLVELSMRSHEMGQRITPQIAAATSLSVLGFKFKQ